MRQFSRALMVVLAAGILGLATAGDALALTSAPDATGMVNGVVRALAISGNTIFVGGQFTKVLQPVSGKVAYDSTDLAAVDMTTGEGIPSWTETFSLAGGTSRVQSLAVSSDGTMLYVGGHFDTVDGVARKNFAAFDIATGTLDPNIDPAFQNPVLVILPEPTVIYTGGAFNRVNNTPRLHLAALNLDGSLNTSWVPDANDSVHSMALSPDGTGVFVGGHFTTMDGVGRQSVAEVDAVTGSLDAWAIPAGVIDTPQTAWAILLTPTRAYIGFGKGPNYEAAFQLDNGSIGTQVWRRSTVGNDESEALSPDGTNLFVGGHFGTGALQQTACQQSLRGAMELNAATGAYNCTGTTGGTAWLPQVTPEGSNFTGVWAMVSTPTQLWIGGKITAINGVTQRGFARYTF